MEGEEAIVYCVLTGSDRKCKREKAKGNMVERTKENEKWLCKGSVVNNPDVSKKDLKARKWKG